MSTAGVDLVDDLDCDGLESLSPVESRLLFYFICAFMVVAWAVCCVCEWLKLDVWDREKDI